MTIQSVINIYKSDNIKKSILLRKLTILHKFTSSPKRYFKVVVNCHPFQVYTINKECVALSEWDEHIESTVVTFSLDFNTEQSYYTTTHPSYFFFLNFMRIKDVLLLDLTLFHTTRHT